MSAHNGLALAAAAARMLMQAHTTDATPAAAVRHEITDDPLNETNYADIEARILAHTGEAFAIDALPLTHDSLPDMPPVRTARRTEHDVMRERQAMKEIMFHRLYGASGDDIYAVAEAVREPHFSRTLRRVIQLDAGRPHVVSERPPSIRAARRARGRNKGKKHV